MAPEQANAEEVDGRCDLFSLGSVLYLACTGELPFGGKDTLSILAALATKTPPPPHKLAPAVPRAFSELVLRLLAKDRDDRPQTAREVVQAIEAIERGETLEEVEEIEEIEEVEKEAPTPAAKKASESAANSAVKRKPAKKPRPRRPQEEAAGDGVELGPGGDDRGGGAGSCWRSWCCFWESFTAPASPIRPHGKIILRFSSPPAAPCGHSRGRLLR